jgi:hypothetical protein
LTVNLSYCASVLKLATLMELEAKKMWLVLMTHL